MDNSDRKRIYDAVRSIKSDSVLTSMAGRSDRDTITWDVLDPAIKVIEPPYSPEKLCDIVESSSILPQCIDAMVRNVDGFGYELHYIGPSDKEKSEEALAEKKALEGFFNAVNERQSFTSVRTQVREDVERIGYGFIEVVRAADDTVSLIYWADARKVRLLPKHKTPCEVTAILKRGGVDVPITLEKRFRRYVMLGESGSKPVFFKEYGDPRRMCAETGKYEDEGEIRKEATELLHIKIGNSTYGIPRWSGVVATVLGATNADYVNYDLFENQVVPPLAILVSGGRLTSESVDDIIDILVKKRGVENFNKVVILEAQSEGSIDDRDRTKVELKELSQARKEDGMFSRYLEGADVRVRSAFRLPGLYIGRSDQYSKSTADSARMVAEEQVFVPIRNEFDELINSTIMQALGASYWKFVSVGPKLIAGEDVVQAVNTFAKYGAFTVNDIITIANRMLGRDVQTFDEEWANYPIPLVFNYARVGAIDTPAADGETMQDKNPDANSSSQATDPVSKFYRKKEEIAAILHALREEYRTTVSKHDRQ